MAAKVPFYTQWDQVPDDCYTTTQLGRLDPPRKPAGEPAGWVLWRLGKRYIPVYRLADTAPKRRQSHAQRAASRRALALRCVCKHCGRQVAEPLGRGRRCAVCRLVDQTRKQQQEAQAYARALVEDPDRVLVHPAAEGDWRAGGDWHTTRVVVIRVADQQVLLDLPADPAARTGPRRYPAVLARLDELMTGLPAVTTTTWQTAQGTYSATSWRVLSWDGWGHVPIIGLLNPLASGRDLWEGRDAYPWLTAWGSVQDPFHRWWADPGQWGWDAYTSYEEIEGSYYHPSWRVPLPGATGDVLADAHTAVRLLHQIVQGTAPVSPRALLHHPPQPGDLPTGGGDLR